jgi:ectoine hydroxylase-related dioxygenase (phytanoyl-CoA dioxygenase family)
MEDSTHDFTTKQFCKLRQRLGTDGYLFVRAVVPSGSCETAARALCVALQEYGAATVNGEIIINEPRQKSDSFQISLGGEMEALGSRRVSNEQKEIWRRAAPLAKAAVFDNASLRLFVKQIFGADAILSGYTSMRAKGNDSGTFVHADYFHYKQHESAMREAFAQLENGDGSVEIPFFTCWIALRDYFVTEGVLAILPASHRLSGFDTPIPNKHLPSGYASNSQRNLAWRIPLVVRAGDIIIFNAKTIHGATANESSPQRYRLSMDVRILLDVVRTAYTSVYGDE